MSRQHTYDREQVAAAVSASHSWRGVMRALGRPEPSAGTLRAIQRQVRELGIDHSHFTGQRRWSDRALRDAVSDARSWTDVVDSLGLSSNSGTVTSTLRAHARRLGIDIAHLSTQPDLRAGWATPAPDPLHLRTAGSALAAAWFMLRGVEVLWPLEPCRYDLAVRAETGFDRVQVKTTTFRGDGTYVARLCNSRRGGQLVYDIDEIELFFVVDGELNAYLIPFAAVSGLQQIHLRAYAPYLVGERGNWLSAPKASERASPGP